MVVKDPDAQLDNRPGDGPETPRSNAIGGHTLSRVDPLEGQAKEQVGEPTGPSPPPYRRAGDATDDFAYRIERIPTLLVLPPEVACADIRVINHVRFVYRFQPESFVVEP
jgi:hypothetical protein